MTYKLLITEHYAKPDIGITEMTQRSEEYATFQLAASQFGFAMDYWANRGSIRRQGEKKFTCTIAPDRYWVTIELV